MKKTSVFLIASSLVLTAGAVLSYKAPSKTIDPYQIETALENNNDYILGRNLLRANDAKGAANLISTVGYQIRANSDTKDLRFVAGVKLDKTDEGGYTLPGSFGFHIAYSVNSKNFDKYIEVNNFYNSFVAGNKIYTNDETAVGTVEDGKTNVSISEFGDYTHFIFLSVRNITSLDTVFTAQSAYKAEGEEDWSGVGDTKYTSYEKKAAIDSGRAFYVVNDNTSYLKTYTGGTYEANIGDKVNRYEAGRLVESRFEMPQTLDYYYGDWIIQENGEKITIDEDGWHNGDKVTQITDFVPGQLFVVAEDELFPYYVLVHANGTISYSSLHLIREGSEPLNLLELDNPNEDDHEIPTTPETPDTPEEPVKKTISDYYGCYLDENKNPMIISKDGMLIDGEIYTPTLSPSGTSISYDDGNMTKLLNLQEDGTLKQPSPYALYSKVADVEEGANLDLKELYGTYKGSGDNTLTISKTCVEGTSGEFPVLYLTSNGLAVYDKSMSSVTVLPYNATTKTVTYFGDGYVKEEPSGCAWASLIGSYKASNGDSFDITETALVWTGGWLDGQTHPIKSFDGSTLVAIGSWGEDNYNLQPDGSFENFGTIYERVA